MSDITAMRVEVDSIIIKASDWEKWRKYLSDSNDENQRLSLLVEKYEKAIDEHKEGILFNLCDVPIPDEDLKLWQTREKL